MGGRPATEAEIVEVQQLAAPASDSWGNVVLLEAVQHEAARDQAAMAMRVALLCRQLRVAGIEPVDKSSDELVALYEHCKAVVEAASRLVEFLGTSKELLEEFS